MVLAFVLATIIMLAIAVGFAGGWFMATRRAAVGTDRLRDDLATTVDLALDAVRHERAETMQAALDTVLSVASAKLGDQLDVGRSELDRERVAVSQQVEGVQAELHRMTALVTELRNEGARSAGELRSKLEHTSLVTSTLANSTKSLERALASPQARGQWGERMAEDVLRAAGFIEGVSYHKQRKLASGGVPDYTFPLPQGHVVHMDVKFPLDNYLRWLDAEAAARPAAAKQFQRDVRLRIKELGDRAYIDPETTVDYLLLFVPNESVYGFLHEHDPGLIDHALGRKVVLCSPTTLFAVLAVVRQAVDTFLVERRSDEILGALGSLREQWERFQEPIDKMGRGLDSARKAYDELSGPRSRQFARQLDRLEEVRDDRAEELPIGGGASEAGHSDGDVGGRPLRQVV